ncbi:2-hydroxyglutaryl-CoA dehydratase [bacterium]|nr:2-hydroxyglutaryl-CoA dehydratase [bacterium]
MLVCGMDVGAATAEAVIFDNSHMISYSILPTGPSVKLIADKVVEQALDKAKLSVNKFDYVVSTGWGRHSVPFADRAVTEIICHGKGAKFLIPSTRTVVDIGGQDSKVISLDENGNVNNFVMNDKCAAGTGRFLEVMANVLEVPLEKMGEISLSSQNPCSISSTCTVFAETEMVFLRAEGKERDDLIAGIHNSVASRVYVLGKSLGYIKDIVFTGGVAKNIGVKIAFERLIGMEMLLPEESQIVGAIGAALIAQEAVAN